MTQKQGFFVHDNLGSGTENPCVGGSGYKRIQGELKKLNIAISKSSVANILRRNGLPPSPERKGLSWREFLARHAPVFLCADMFQKEVWAFRGLTTAYVFFVIHLQTRQVILSRATFSPTN